MKYLFITFLLVVMATTILAKDDSKRNLSSTSYESSKVSIYMEEQKPYQVGDTFKIKIIIDCRETLDLKNIGSFFFIVGFDLTGLTPWEKINIHKYSTTLSLKVKELKKYESYICKLIEITNTNNHKIYFNQNLFNFKDNKILLGSNN